MTRFQRLHIGGRVAGQREDAAFQRAAEEGRVAVQDELLAAGADLTQAERHRALVVGLVALEWSGERLERGAELVPGLCLVAQRHLELGGAACFHPNRPPGFAWPIVSVPWPALPVALPMRTFTRADLPRQVRIHLHVLDPDRAGR